MFMQAQNMMNKSVVEVYSNRESPPHSGGAANSQNSGTQTSSLVGREKNTLTQNTGEAPGTRVDRPKHTRRAQAVGQSKKMRNWKKRDDVQEGKMEKEGAVLTGENRTGE